MSITEKQIEEIRAMYPEEKPGIFNYMAARETTFALIETINELTAERDAAFAKAEAWDDANCDTCPIRSWSKCDEICRSKSLLIEWLYSRSNSTFEATDFHNRRENIVSAASDKIAEAQDRRLVMDITGVLNAGISETSVKDFLRKAGVSDITVKTLPQYDDWKAGLPTESIQGLSERCCEWIHSWGVGGGDLSTEACISDSINEQGSDVPGELADIVYGSVADYCKTEFEALGLTIKMIDECLTELREEADKADGDGE